MTGTWWTRLPLGTKLLLASLAVELMMLTLLLLSTLTVVNDSLDAQFRQRRAEIDHLVTVALAGPLASRDLAALQEVLDALHSDRGIRHLEVRDGRGQMVASSGAAATSDGQAELPVVLAGTPYGTLRYDIDTGFFEEARQRLLKGGTLIALTLMALSAVVLTALSVLITGRLTQLADAASAIAGGDLAARVPVGPPDEVGRLAVSFNAMADTLAERVDALARSNADLEQFAWVASHDLREPLRMVSVYVELLNRRYADRLDDDARVFIGYASDGARRMDRLILDLLQYSLVSRDGRPLVPTPLAQPFEAACANLRVAIADSGAAIEVRGPLPVVMGDHEQLARLLQNLIGNGIKYRAPDRPPRLVVGAEPAENGGWVVSVTDNGIGIEPQYFERIFQLFQRLHGRDTYDGTGIGLAVCRRIVDRHHGRLWVDSEPGSGSTFKVYLPAPPAEVTP
jgi:signal transduction histidine kinase